ncbi:copper amine oxidase [Deinococcus sp. RL]|uniref:stalk domain-containing protein n=1 Tax=Deinococcus sp. RL TaxID=1489678 RepID=UPI0004D76E0A|nr:stalk domain-containing protein [Deinococcus sp. RL]KEF34861.1 copper amine oxidase [Deinococcus sp. RL]
MLSREGLFRRSVLNPRRSSRSLLTALLLGAAPLAGAQGAAQLTLTTDQTVAYVNGVATPLPAAPRLIGGRTLVPLRETAALLGQPVSEVGGQLQVGRLNVDPARGTVFLAGAAQPSGSVVDVSGVPYVPVRLLADALNATLSVGPDGRTLTLAALAQGVNPLAPQARFSTDKTVYAPGERVVYTEYAFDPDGADLTSRRWTGRQEVFFQPGTYTVTLQVTNSRGLQSAPFSRTLRVEGPAVDTPLTYALKYAEPGDRFPDPQLRSYPLAPTQPTFRENHPLLFSNSPEVPTQSGVLYQDSLAGRVRLLGYHINGLKTGARLHILARNLEGGPVELRTERQGETAPTRIETLLGQVTLLDYFASTGGPTLTLAPGATVPVYSSPTLTPGTGVNVMQDLVASGRVELTFLMLEEALPPTAQVAQQLPYLPHDGKHQRGTFENAVRGLRVNLTTLPARLVIGDGQVDPAITGVDKLTGQPQRLAGNYGVRYHLEVYGAAGTAVAFSPRGGLYRGAMHVQDGPLAQTIKLPRTGNAIEPDQPVLLWRTRSDRLDLDLVPASGSNLPVSLIFYRGGTGTGTGTGYGGLFKPYQP